MTRVEQLNKHLEALIRLNAEGGYDEDIQNTLYEINRELGIDGQASLKTYSTRELHEELADREAVDEIVISNDQEIVIDHILGELGQSHSYNGPVRVLINRD